MKKLILLTLTALIASPLISSAQLNKGNFMLGAGLGFSTSSTTTDVSGTAIDEKIGDTKTTNFDFTPKIGYFLADNFATGLQFQMTRVSATTENETNVGSKFLAGPFARYYIPLGESRKAFLFEADAGFGNTRVAEGGVDVSTSLFGLGFGPGITIISTDNIGMEALAKYNWVRGVSEINEKTSTETVSEFGVQLGFQVYLNRNRRVAPTNTMQ